MLESFSVQHRVWLAVAVVAASCTWFLMRRRKWVPVGKLTNIYIYPLKSGHWQELPEAECTSIGPRYSPNSDKVALRDRVFLAYDKEKMEFISGKLCPKMIYIDVVPKTSKTVVFSHPDMKDIEVTLPEHFDDDIITMWAHEKIRTVDCGDAIAKWMSELIRGQPEGVRVGYWPETEKWRRNIEALRAKEIEIFKNMSNKHTGAYSDLSSYHLVSKDSVADLNKRLEDTKKVEPLNFRPNLVIEGAAPYDEDKWDWIKIGEVVFRRFRPCTRCNFTTVNPETAQKSPFNEPIKTLKTYRTMKQLGEERVDPHYPVMGQYIGVVEPGIIKAGDTVFISS